MENFNPIKELKPEDPFNAPEGESSDEIESIRLTLISTRNKTRELVNVIKKKNLDFVKDTTTIKDLDRRLRITIARIPIMRGDASTRSDQDEDPSMIFRTFNRRSRTTKTPTDTRVPPTPKIGERIRNAIIDAVMIALPIKIPGGKQLLKLTSKLGIKTGTKKLTKEALEKAYKKSKSFDDTRKILEPTASKKSTGFGILDFFRKKLTPKIDPKKLINRSKYEQRRENMRRVRLEGDERTGLFEKKKKVEYENFFDRGRVKNAEPKGFNKRFKNTFKKNDEKTLESLYKEIDRLQKKLKEITNSRTLDEAEKKVKTRVLLEEIIKKRRVIQKKYPGADPVITGGGKSLSFNSGGGTGSDYLNGKSMNNDIAMLNRDTSVTNTRVFLMGEIT